MDVTTYVTTVGGNVSISQGNGNSDTATVDVTTAGGNVTINQGNGNSDTATVEDATVGGNVTITQGSGSGDTATVLDVTALTGNITITQTDVAGNATGDTANVIGVTAGTTIPATYFVIDFNGTVTITQGNAPGDVAYLDRDAINNVTITQGDNVQAPNGSTVVSDVAEINDTSVTSNVSISQGTGTSTAINAGNYVAAIGFDYLGYINGTPASSSVTVGGDTYIDQNYANNQVYLGEADSSFTTVYLDVFTGSGGGAFVFAANTTVYFGSLFDTYTIDGGGTGNTYYDGGNSGVTVDPANFNTATVNASFWALLTPVLTWADPVDITYGTPLSSTQLDATANIPGTFTYTLAAGTVLHAGQQTLSVQFTPTDTSDYTDATAMAVINVTPAPLTVTADNASKIYGAALPTLTASYTGFVNGDTSASLTTQPTLGTTATAASPVGTYAITASGAVDGDYSITYANGTLTVTPAPLTITANNPTKVYGQANPALTGTISGLVNGDTDIATYTTTATASSGVGTYAITPSLSDSNYNITFNNGTLTVTPATPVITWANPADITYGTPLSSTQLDATANIPGTFIYTLAAGTVLHAGQQTLSVQFTPTDTSDYTDATATAVINVTPAPLTITANNATKVYGRALPTLTGQLHRLRQRRHLGQPHHATDAGHGGDRGQPRRHLRHHRIGCRGQRLQHHLRQRHPDRHPGDPGHHLGQPRRHYLRHTPEQHSTRCHGEYPGDPHLHLGCWHRPARRPANPVGPVHPDRYL